MESIDIEAFKQLLRETMQWCVPRVTLIDPKHSLRTLPLNTESDLDTIERYELRQIAENLFQERARLYCARDELTVSLNLLNARAKAARMPALPGKIPILPRAQYRCFQFAPNNGR
ncbi:MAG: hypothetical protein L0229_30740 [Blastocatellia bacterium]|nr:hypothetical protein [Blastocatellia bacterium]